MAGLVMRSVAAIVATVLLAGCAAGPPKLTSRQIARIDRALAGAPGAAQPSTIVATEVAFARMAREDGQWTAFRRFATADALMHGRAGTYAAQPWLAGQTDPAEAVRWAPRAVWMSCDATLAVSQGRYRYPAGNVGTYVTVWQRQEDGTYRWLYDAGSDDDPQPVRAPDAEIDEDTIVVTAFDTIRGEVADCREAGGPPPPPLPQATYEEGTATGGGTAADGTLGWRWVHLPDGRRQVVASIYRDGGWEQAAKHDFGHDPAG